MTSRRSFLAGSGLMAAGAVLASRDAAAAKEPDTMPRFRGPREMPKNVVLLTIAHADGTETLGVKTKAGVIDVRAAARHLAINAPWTLDELLQEGNGAGLSALIAAAGRPEAKAALLDEAKISYGRLFARPGKIICVGLNYRRHAQEIGMAPPRVPPLFNKYDNALAPHNGTIKLPPPETSYKFDYETELLMVMGKEARNVPEARGLDYVAGYCIGHDFSARDLQLELPAAQWMIGKTLDGFAPIGPYFVSADLVGDPNKLKIETRVNGQLRQSSNTADFIANCQQLVAYISRFWTLQPGDIIFTGTPEGVIAGKPKDQQVWLKAGDEIVSSIEKLGELRFRLA